MTASKREYPMMSFMVLWRSGLRSAAREGGEQGHLPFDGRDDCTFVFLHLSCMFWLKQDGGYLSSLINREYLLL